MSRPSLGIIGGTGELGSAIARAVLGAGWVTPDRLWIANRSGAGHWPDWPGIHFTADPADLARSCEAILLAVPPDQLRRIGLNAPDRLILSVMAGATIAQLQHAAGSRRVIRAMSSPAAGRHLAYSPWVAAPAATPADRDLARGLFAACGATDELADETHLDVFPAVTGPVPGFAAFFAECLAAYVEKAGLAPGIAEKAVRQLLLASGTIMAQEARPAASYVDAMIDYDGTTAAGLRVLRQGPFADALAEGLEAAVAKARRIAE